MEESKTAEQMTEKPIKSCTGVDLFCRYWKPVSSQPRAVVFLAHGFGEHLDYYEELATALQNESFYVFAHDHVGHGRSKGSRVYIDSVDDYVKDVVNHFENINNEIPKEIPRFIVGHSMGGTIAIKTAMHHPQMFRGVVLIAPAVVIAPELATPIKIFLAKIVSRIAPQFPIAPIDWNIVTRNKDRVEKYSKDNLCNQGRVKAKWVMAMYYAMQEINNNLTNIEWPYYLLHGSDDLITDISGSKLLHNLSSSKDKQFKIYDKASHNLLQELDDVRSSVLTEITSWISNHLHPASESESAAGGDTQDVRTNEESFSKQVQADAPVESTEKVTAAVVEQDRSTVSETNSGVMAPQQLVNSEGEHKTNTNAENCVADSN